MPPELEPVTYAEVMWNPTIYLYWVIVSFLLGSIVGSFLNVCIYRVPLGLSPNKPKRSFCFRCGTPISWFDNIPILSYLLLGGKCRSCGAGFSPRYMMVEVFTGIVFMAVFLTTNPSAEDPFLFATFWYWAFASLLIVGTFTDLDHWIIPDGVTLYGAVVAFLAALAIGFVDGRSLLTDMGPFPAFRVFWEDGFAEILLAFLGGPGASQFQGAEIAFWEPVANSVLGAVFGVGLLYAIQVLGKVAFGKDAMGTGDVKLFALIGATLGIMGSVYTLMAASMLGAFFGILVMKLFKPKSNSEAALSAGRQPAGDGEEDVADEWIDAVVEEREKKGYGPRVHHLPFGPWIAAGALLVLLFHKHIQEFLFSV